MTATSTSATSGPAAAGLVHQAVLHDGPAALVDALAPQLESALRDGHTVSAVVDREIEDALRARIGRDAAGIAFGDPAEVLADPAQTLVARRRRDAVAGCEHGPMTLVGQFQPWMRAEDVAFWECMSNLVLADLPLTLVCACPVSAGDALAAFIATHPELRTSTGATDNPAFQDPLTVLAAHPPLAPPLLGAPTGAREFRSAHDLRHLRSAITAYVEVAGLPAERVDDAVLAVSEMAANCLTHGGGHGQLLMWAAGGELVWEVHDAGRPGGSELRLTPDRFGLTLPTTAGVGGRGMWIAREVCDDLHVWQAGPGTSVRGTIRA